jgi:hypothetical protein
MGDAAPQAARGGTSSEHDLAFAGEALEALRLAWGDLYMFGRDDKGYWAARPDVIGSMVRAADPVALGVLLAGATGATAAVTVTGTWCRRCDEIVIVDDRTGYAVHTGTQQEKCADGRAVVVTAIDPARRDEAQAIAAGYQELHPGLCVAWYYTHFQAWMQGRDWMPVEAGTGDEMRARLDARLGVRRP